MSSPFKVLVVDDDTLSRATTAKQLAAAGYEAAAAEGAGTALEILGRGPWDVVLTDLRMPDMDGVDLLTEVKRRFPQVEVILMTAFGSVESAVQAMRVGAADYLTKPFQFEELDLRLRRILELRTTRHELDRLRGMLDVRDDTLGLVGRSPQIQLVRERVRTFAGHDAPVLVTGETGTGKEVVARALHESGRRSKSGFVPVGCGTIPSELAESELFGHERGSFTGATGQRKGAFERADAGTLLLDDVDDLPLDMQAKLLRVLQEGTFVRVGGSREIAVDVRVIATTKVDLAEEVERGRFRADLFYRLRGLEIGLPPLRERGEDILLLADHFLDVVAATQGRASLEIGTEAAHRLLGYSWPGNVRELYWAVESASILCQGGEIASEHLPGFLRQQEGATRLFTLHLEGAAAISFAQLSQEFQDALVAWAMRKAEGSQTEASKLLGLPRTTLQSKLTSQSGE